MEKIGDAEYQEQLKKDKSNLQDQVEQLTQNIGRKQYELNQLKVKITNLDGLKEINKTLELHNQALKEAQNQLRLELNELTSKNENKAIFTEFMKIDENCNSEYRGFYRSHTLNDFINAIGYALQEKWNLYYEPKVIRLFVAGLAMSRLHLLQGISGTGKTKLAQAFADVVGGEKDCCQTISVQAGWRDNQDLLGYYNAFEKKFYEKPFSKAIYMASTPKYKDRLVFILLDEMNLSHPEQYFADFLSALEQTKNVSDPFDIELLSGIAQNVIKGKNWPKYLNGEKIRIPSNVWFIGTANHDETTMEFADKTYDRSHIMIMERNERKTNYNEVELKSCHWNIKNIFEAFDQAKQDHERETKWVKEKLEAIKNVLEEEFEVSFGNRLDRQIDSFVPVLCAAGGTQNEAIDHLIATKIIRKGKVTGLFGVKKESLENLKKIIMNNIGLKEDSATIRLLNRDIKSKE